MNMKILLTYNHKDGYATYEWFEGIEECNEFVKNNKNNMTGVFECMHIENSTDMMNKLRNLPK